MSFGATTGERLGARHWPRRAGRRGQPQPAGEDSRSATPASCDADAVLDKLYALYWSDLVSYVNGMLADPHQAEEIVQETMLRAWRHADKLTPDRGSVWGWLCRVAHNAMVDRIRHKRARPAEVEETAATSNARVVVDHGPDVVDSVHVVRVLALLQPAHRAVLYLVYYQDRTCVEAAAVLGVPVGTVKSRLHYGLRHLRVLLAADRAEHQ